MTGKLVVVWACACSLATAGSGIQVDEARSRISLRGDGPVVSLAVVNPLPHALDALVRVEWLQTDDIVVFKKELNATIAPGASDIRISTPFKVESPWYRLRYSLGGPDSTTRGVVALAQLARDLFELRVSGPFSLRSGDWYEATVRALHPITFKPVAGVQLKATLDLLDSIETTGVTGADGTARLKFKLPASADDGDEADLGVTGSIGTYSQDVETQIEFEPAIKIGITTDKPMYQPGQTVHIRALCFRANNKAAADEKLTFEVEDPEGSRVFGSNTLTTRFGVASADWSIPSNVRLGDYNIIVETENGGKGRRTEQMVKISRYDLPNFSVAVQPDRTYYLPGQDASIEIRADYLFGKPVARGHVRVVRETNRKWNFKEQKWEIEEGEKYEGEADAAGRYTACIPLARSQEKLGDTRLYEDLTFTAYVLDPSSGRTEQRRFDVRVTKDPVHVYLIHARSQGRYYVSTNYADGTPARCRILSGGKSAGKTNKYGLARIDVSSGDAVDITADDGHGGKGHLMERLYGSEALLKIQTDKTLYQNGEAIRVKIEASPDRAIPLQVFRDRRLLTSRWVDLSKGRAEVDVPWRPEFVNEITIGVATDSYHGASKTVIFPHNTDLKLSVKPANPEYRPGEEANVGLRMLSPEGTGIEGVFGVSIVDAAVGERTRTDRQSAQGRYYFDWSWLRPGISDQLAGVTRHDLNTLDASKPFDPDIDLLAEVMVASDGYWPRVTLGMDYGHEAGTVFNRLFRAELKGVKFSLDSSFEHTHTYPRDAVAVKQLLSQYGIDFDSLQDPWGTPFHVRFDVQRQLERMVVVSAGPDKRFGTEDDIEALVILREYFKGRRDVMLNVLNRLPAFPTTESDARVALRGGGIDVDELRDPWGGTLRMRLDITGPLASLQFVSAGPDGQFGTTDDFVVGAISGSYFKEAEKRINEALAKVKTYPQNDEDWRTLLGSAGVLPLNDPWGRPLYAVFRERAIYADVTKGYVEQKYGGEAHTRTTVVPMTAKQRVIMLRSAGSDGLQGTMDDFDLAVFTQTTEIETGERERMPSAKNTDLRNCGAITGTVLDQTGAVIPNAKVRAQPHDDGSANFVFEAMTGPDGTYELSGLLPQLYDVRIESSGFMPFVMMSVPVQVGHSTVVDAVLRVGSTMETVSVESQAPTIQTESAAVAGSAQARATPRLREYFPETLLWAPSVETDRTGRARLKFKLADNITTWKLAVTGSTATGEIGTATADIRAFQPFFVDHDPPRVLTQGDELQLPVTVRNYLERAQDVSLAMKPEDWFRVSGPTTVRKSIAAGGSTNAVFDVTAVQSIGDGKQRLTATSAQAGDAIEKPVTVHPDGREISHTSSEVLRRETSLATEVPAEAIPGSLSAELVVYPNIGSHLMESIEAILERPYGCGEQTISSTYTSLLLLEYLKSSGIKGHPLEPKARRYLQRGYQRLLGYRAESGGFRYWGHYEAADPALTAYALSFLHDAGEFIEVAKDVVDQAYKWLASEKTQTEVDAYVAMALAGVRSSDAAIPSKVKALSLRADALDEPYTIGAFAIAARRNGMTNESGEALDRLRRLAHKESDSVYWELRTNTPFNGWGRAGRIETTALVLKALILGGSEKDQELIDGALLFLMRNTDRYGVWYSTQATVQALQAMTMAAAWNKAPGESGPIDILVNGHAVTRLPAPGKDTVAGPLRVDIARWLAPGKNQVALRRNAGQIAQARLSASYYVPWTEEHGAGEDLHLSVAFDRLTAQPGETVKCTVKAERVAYRGHGMLLAEIGLPPGADVDRQSLERAVEGSGWAFSEFDILPDKVVAYLWPAAGGTKFEFQFRTRMGMRAKAAASKLYDYYNPEAEVVVAPARFVIGGQ